MSTVNVHIHIFCWNCSDRRVSPPQVCTRPDLIFSLGRHNRPPPHRLEADRSRTLIFSIKRPLSCWAITYIAASPTAYAFINMRDTCWTDTLHLSFCLKCQISFYDRLKKRLHSPELLLFCSKLRQWGKKNHCHWTIVFWLLELSALSKVLYCPFSSYCSPGQ